MAQMTRTRIRSTSNDANQEAPKAAKIRVRYAESKQVRDMRENYEKAEKRAMRSSKAYRYVN